MQEATKSAAKKKQDQEEVKQDRERVKQKQDQEEVKQKTAAGEDSSDESDEEELKEKIALETVGITKTRRPDTKRYIEKKLAKKGVLRMERHPADGLSLTHIPKSGHGGKFTWEGPDDTAESELDPVPPAVDPRDPNYVEEEEEEMVVEEEEGAPVIGEVEVAKVAEAKEGVSRIEVRPPLESVISK